MKVKQLLDRLQEIVDNDVAAMDADILIDTRIHYTTNWEPVEFLEIVTVLGRPISIKVF